MAALDKLGIALLILIGLLLLVGGRAAIPIRPKQRGGALKQPPCRLLPSRLKRVLRATPA